MSILPIKTKIRGPAPLVCTSSLVQGIGRREHSNNLVNDIDDPEQLDIIDETLDLFRANSLFRNFEIKGPADRLLIILILFISDCLAKISASRTPMTQLEASKTLNTLSVDQFPLPGDATFPLNAHYAAPNNRIDAGAFLFIHSSELVHLARTVLIDHKCQITCVSISSRHAKNSLRGS